MHFGAILMVIMCFILAIVFMTDNHSNLSQWLMLLGLVVFGTVIYLIGLALFNYFIKKAEKEEKEEEEKDEKIKELEEALKNAKNEE